MTAKTALGALILVGLIAIPAQADIIRNKSRRTAQDDAARESLKASLGRLGVSAPEARQIVEGLQPEEARFFFESPRANGVVAGLWLEEWIGAILYIAYVGDNVYDNWRRYIIR